MYPGVKQRAQLISPSRSAWLIMSWSSCFVGVLIWTAPRRGRTFSPTWSVIAVRSPSNSVALSPSLSTTRGRYDGSPAQSVGQSGRRMREAGAAPGRRGLLTWLLKQNERGGRLAGWQHACIDGWVDGLTYRSAAAHNHRAQPAHRRGVEPAIHSPINSVWLH